MKTFTLTVLASLIMSSASMAAEKTCSLQLAPKVGKTKFIEIDVVKETTSEVLYKKTAGNFSVEILVKDLAGESNTYISLVDTQTKEKIGTVSDTLTLERPNQKVVILCSDAIF